MGAASLAALLVSRPASRWYALLLAACVTLVLNPRATAIPAGSCRSRRWPGSCSWRRRSRDALAPLPRLLAEGIAVTAAATLATAPLLAHHFGTVPLAGLAGQHGGAAAGRADHVAGDGARGAGPGIPGGRTAGRGAGQAANLAAGWALEPLARALGGRRRGLRRAAGRAARRCRWARAPALLAAYAALAAAVLARRRLLARVDAEPPVARAGAASRLGRRARGRRPSSGASLAIGAAALLAPPAPPGRLTVSFLDVGQGDATLIQHPDGSVGPVRRRAARGAGGAAAAARRGARGCRCS